MTDYVLGVDIGSGSVKLTLLSREGKIAATAGCEYPTYYPHVGWCEQDPEDWCRAFKTAFGDILKTAGVGAERIKALSFDAATHTAVLLGEQKQVLRRAILWTDQRSKAEVQELKDTCLDTIMDQAVNAPTTVWTLPQLMWLRRHEPEIWGQIRYILFAKDYLRFRMTGTMETDTIDAEGSMFYDTRRERWSEELCAVGGIRKEWLPRLCRPTDVAGTMTGERAAEFGLAEGTVVLVGTTDTVMELFAAGNVEPGHATVKLATAGRICIVTDHALDSKFIFNYRHVVPGLWYPGTATKSCAASNRWYRDTFGGSFDEMSKAAAEVSRGCEGLFFHPYLQGEITPYLDDKLRASFVGAAGFHTKAHFNRAVLEGVAYSMKDCFATLVELGIAPTQAVAIGGGAKSGLWRQILADMLNIPLKTVENVDSSLGSAMLAGVAVGVFASHADAVERCVREQGVTLPDPEGVDFYNERFKLYKEIQAALAPIYHKL